MGGYSHPAPQRHYVRCTGCEWVGWRYAVIEDYVSHIGKIRGRACPGCGQRRCVLLSGPQLDFGFGGVST